MKSIILVIVSFASTITFGAVKNPQIRTCHLNGGDFVAVSTSNDQVGLCKLGNSYIGSLELMNFENKISIGQSINTYMKENTSCDPFGTTQTVNTLENQNIDVCTFEDGSMIDSESLKKGSQSEENKKLNSALGI